MPENQMVSITGKPAVAFTIDGVEYTSEQRQLTAAELLELAQVDASSHDLARIVGQGKVEKKFRDDELVQLTPRATFVSVFTGPTPVV